MDGQVRDIPDVHQVKDGASVAEDPVGVPEGHRPQLIRKF
jgi:hypothetical protein